MNKDSVLDMLAKSADYRAFDEKRENASFNLCVATIIWIEREYDVEYDFRDNPEEIPFAYTTYGDDEDDVQVYVDAVHMEFIFELNGNSRVRKSVDASDIPYVDFSEIIAEAYDLLK